MSYSVPDIRLAMDLKWWERAVERLGLAERWEWHSPTGWHRYWRRDGSIPRPR